MITEKRRGEIALACLKYRMGREGIRLTPDIKRELGNMAKAIGIPREELRKFMEGSISELLYETLGQE